MNRNYLIYSLFILLATFVSCQPAGQDSEEVTATTEEAPETSDVEAYSLEFNLAEGDCQPDDMLTINLGAGDDLQMPVVSAYALRKVTVTSMQGKEMPTRDGFTLFIGDYAIDTTKVGVNPASDQAKIEMTFITQDNTPLANGVYTKTSKSNMAVGPNLFYRGKAYPMKNNFEGGVKITSHEGDYLCGEIKLVNKFDVKIDGKFKAKFLKSPQ